MVVIMAEENNLEGTISPELDEQERLRHDQCFKELISKFFLEFLELFVPELAALVEPDSVRFLQQEYFTDVLAGEKKIIDLLAEVKLRGKDSTIVIHFEAQSSSESDFNRRLFYYFAVLHQRQVKDIYPIVVFSFDKPFRAESDQYQVEVAGLRVLDFRFKAIQLNRMNWRDYLDQQNPVAAALMAKMKIAPEDRPKVKAECLRLLVTLRLDPAKMSLVSKFVDTYLQLDRDEEKTFQAEVDRMDVAQKEEIMQVTTSWERKGIEQGKLEGKLENQRSIALNMLKDNLPLEQISRWTGLSIAELQKLQES
jgi:predicted transposase/invertase (TIGR01784 family)